MDQASKLTIVKQHRARNTNEMPGNKTDILVATDARHVKNENDESIIDEQEAGISW